MDSVANEESIVTNIVKKRHHFITSLTKHKGPPIIPTVFRNHPERHMFVKNRDRELYSVRSPRFPPKPPSYIFTSASDVYLAIQENFEKKLFVIHDDLAKLLCLRMEVCGELAMEDMLNSESTIYSENEESRVNNQYLDPNSDKWYKTLPCTCKYVADFSVILPEGNISTVSVTCPYCRFYVETVLPVSILGKMKTEMCKVVNSINFSGENTKSVARLPMQSVGSKGCLFTDGLLGVKPLTGSPTTPSVFVRTRLNFYCNEFSLFGKIVHKNDSYVNTGKFL